ncbi:MAG TPA: hypothetical protein EYO33_06235 [Phycisphaerales bacterium]|nr:hypothetical protein [Phycisphaerales bacterium]
MEQHNPKEEWRLYSRRQQLLPGSWFSSGRCVGRVGSSQSWEPAAWVQLLAMLLFLTCGGLWYYSTCLRWKSFEDPLAGLTFVQGGRGELHSFREQTVNEIVDPALLELKRLEAPEKGADGQQGEETRNRILKLIKKARRARIPLRDKKQYHQLLFGLVEASDAADLMGESNHSDDELKKEALLERSRQRAERAAGRLKQVKNYFQKDLCSSMPSDSKIGPTISTGCDALPRSSVDDTGMP